LILQYPAYASEETLQKIRKKTTDQTIKENNKLNTTAGSKSKGWGKKSSDPLTVLITKTDRTDDDLLWRHKQGFGLDQIEEKRVKELLKKE